jgi:hypothetical protein
MPKNPPFQRLGVIADTHGLVRPKAFELMADCDLVLHAGDVGSLEVLEQLQQAAPVIAVKGNVDKQGGVAQLPATEAMEFAGHWLYLLHNLDELDIDPQAAGFSAVIYGHSHSPRIDWREGVLYFNPGSAGPRRFRLPICVGFIDVSEAGLRARLVDVGEGLGTK